MKSAVDCFTAAQNLLPTMARYSNKTKADSSFAPGCSIIAQDEATSVVWGMPGAAAQTGMCCEILPITRIGPKISGLLSGGPR